jgi:hypothetical protein
MAAPAAAGADLDLDPDRRFPGRLVALVDLLPDDLHRQQAHGDGASLEHVCACHARGAREPADADGDAEADDHAHQVGLPVQHRPPDPYTDAADDGDAIGDGDGDANCFSGRLAVTLAAWDYRVVSR